MPSVTISKKNLLNALGKELTETEIDNTVFDFGVELDEIYEEDGETMFKFDVAANRYDLLCLEGFSAALSSYLGISNFSDINLVSGNVSVFKNKTHERQHIACAIIRGIKFDKVKYDSFISYQDKLHSSIGRNRSLVAIGTHDLSKVNGRITYSSQKLSDISFVPLKNEKSENFSEINGASLESFYSKDKKISKFFSLLSDSQKCVVFKCNDQVMSLPPIINSDLTKISIDTTDIFVEVTGADFNKVNTALKYILYNFRGEAVETVNIVDVESNSVVSTPVFNNYTYSISIEKINKKLYLDLSGSEIKRLLEKMMYKVEFDQNNVHVCVYDARSDVLHECDIIEDIAIAYGFNNFELRCPPIYTVGFESPLNKFSDKLRTEMALFGFIEVLTLTLLSKAENIVDLEKAVELSNPKSKEYEVVRTSLLPGVLKSIASNLHAKIPIKAFEVADVVYLSDETDENAKNERRLCAVIASNKSLLEDVQGPLSLLFEKCGITEYSYEPRNDKRYLENQSAVVKIEGTEIGTLGVLHPTLCQKFEIPYAASSFEINLQVIFERFFKK